MHIITHEYCKSIAEQLNDLRFRSMTSSSKAIVFALLRAFWLIRQKRYNSAEECIAVGIENIVKHYGLK